MLAAVTGDTSIVGFGKWAALLLLLLLGECQWGAVATAQSRPAVGSWQMIPGKGSVELRHNGDLVTVYHAGGGDFGRPYFYPLIGPGGVEMTRPVPAEQGEDHPEHCSLWFGLRDVNGVDFWSGKAGADAGTQVHTGFRAVQIRPGSVTLKTTNDWLASDGHRLMQDRREFRLVKARNGAVVLDFAVVLMASDGRVRLGSAGGEGCLGLRMAHWLRLLKKDRRTQQQGTRVVTSEGVEGPAANDGRAEWIDFSGLDPNGRTTGIAMMGHPDNPQHPAWWRVQDFGLAAADPFGRATFAKGKLEGGEEWVMEKGEELPLRWRVFIHPGAAQPQVEAGGGEDSSGVAAEYADFLR